MRWALIFAGFCGVLLGVAVLVLWLFGEFRELGLSAHGWIAMILGIAATSAVAVLLMGLVFYSNRSAHDQAVFDETRDRR